MVFQEAKKKSEPEVAGNLPLFFQSPVPLELERHKKAGILPTQNYTFAASTNSIPLDAIEFAEAAKDYPIVFTMDESIMPVVVTGLEKQNYFVSNKGDWKQDSYVPAYVRKYPFVFMDLSERQQFLLCVDEAAVHYKAKGGEGTLAFYDGDQPSEMTKNALEFCTAFHNHYQITRQFCDALKAENLFEPTQSDAKLSTGREIRLSGFQVIDEKKFNALPDAKILEFRQQGWLPLIYFALMSGTNWQRLIELAAELDRRKNMN